jgi:hypothetical protein
MYSLHEKILRIFRYEKNPRECSRGFYKKGLAMTYFHMSSLTLSSARSGFTSEFEMGSGGSRSLWSPGKLTGWGRNYFLSCVLVLLPVALGKVKRSLYSHCMSSSKLLGCYMVKPHGQLVLVSFVHYCTSTPSLSTL